MIDTVLNPLQPVLSERSSALEDAEETLATFKAFMKQTYPKASGLYETAKNLWQDIYNLRHKKESQDKIADVFKQQSEIWDRLEKDSDELKKSVDDAYAKVTIADERVKKAQGVYPSVAALGFRTPEQKSVKHVYAKKLKYAFHDAKNEYSLLCSYPDGMLCKIRKLRESTMAGFGGEAVHVEHSSCRLEVLDDADTELQTFKAFVSGKQPEANRLLQRAKYLHHEAGFVHSSDKSESWTKIVQEATALRKTVDAAFSKLAESEDSVKRAGGVYPSVAALGFTTPNQAFVRSAYAHKYKLAFDMAKNEYYMLCSTLTQTIKLQNNSIRDLHAFVAEAGHAKPTHAEPAHAEPAHAEPAHAEPAHAEPAHAEPARTKPAHAEHRLEVLDDADKVLQIFKEFIEEKQPEAKHLLQRAKYLHHEAGFVHNTEQSESWTKIADKAAALHKAVHGAFLHVVAAENCVQKAGGVYPSVAALGFITPDQIFARNAYAQKYKHAFENAKNECDKLCGLPNGTLTKIIMLQKDHAKMATE